MIQIDYKGHKIDALLISSLANVRYLTGFTGSNGMVLLTPDSMTLITDPRYGVQSRQEAKQCKIVVAKRPLREAAVSAIKRKKLRRVGFEESRLTFDEHKEINEALPLGHYLKPIGPVIDALRMIKTDDEIACIRQSVNTNSDAFAAVLKRIREGMTESDIAADLDHQMRRHGADGTAFETIVACGDRTALPHARPTRQKLGANELLLIDMGASRDGYMSDMTRMLFLGKPSGKIRSMYARVLDSQLAAIAAVRHGASTRQIDLRAREVLKAAGLEKAFVHSTGHGLGLEIHEAPKIGKKDSTRLKAGMVITIEPGAYVEGLGGMRVEDTVLVTKTGCEVLTPTSKELILL